MRNNLRRFFHGLIIACVGCIALSGCGHKADPIYVADEPQHTHAK